MPFIDGAQSTRRAPIAAPLGLVESLSRQLDLKRKFASPDLVVFENTAWVPVRSQLTQVGSESSQLAGAQSMITADISGATPLPATTYPYKTTEVDVVEGTLHLANPFTSQWTVEVDGKKIEPRPAFGLTNAYDIATPGRARISFDTSVLQSGLVGVQAGAWAVLIFFALSRRRRRQRQQQAPIVVHEPAFVLQAESEQ